MINKELYEYITSNIGKLYENIHSVFDVSVDDFKKIIMHIASISKKDDFYSGLVTVDRVSISFSKGNLTLLKKYLTKMNIDGDTIKRIIVDTPEIILFSDQIDLIFPIFKGHDFKGYALLKDNKYKAYDFSGVLNKYYKIIFNENTKRFESTSYLKEGNPYENDAIVSSMLELLSRKDIKAYFGLTDSSTLKEKFYALSSKYNKRNYYFYKERNPLMGLKAKLTTYDRDRKYHCDLCGAGFDNPNGLKTHLIVPLEESGVDEIYNVSCLCGRCYSMINSHDNSISQREELINALKARMERIMPEYLNKINSYFDIKDSKKM